MTKQIPPDPPGSEHLPVLLTEILEGLQIRPGIRIIDGTVGGGGHTAAFLANSNPDGQILGVDADPAAINRVNRRLHSAVQAKRLALVQGNFGELHRLATESGFTGVDAILLDLGVSSFQLETPDRGFSFAQDGPLDMRFNPHTGLSAAEIVNQWPETELADLIFQYGEERLSRRIARCLVRYRPFTTTSELANAIEEAVGGRRGSRLHPATRTFQALRISVNQELQQLEQVLPQCLDLLKPGGRMAIIAFHSLEDRIVKQWMQKEARTFVPDQTNPQGGYERRPTLAILTRKPMTATDTELTHNPRSRSAKLRIAARI